VESLYAQNALSLHIFIGHLRIVRPILDLHPSVTISWNPVDFAILKKKKYL
jgi:hypothetical protein